MTETVPPHRILPFGDAALVVEFGDAIDRAVSAWVLALDQRVGAAAIPGLVETVPSFRSLLVIFDPLTADIPAAADALEALLATPMDPHAETGRLWRLPCCYEPGVALDLASVAEALGMSADAVVERHAAVEHHVYMIGFLPGSPYLGDLPADLALPRRAEPRTRVPAGSVAIATGLTVVYPVESPGGWHILGRSPAPLFSVEDDPPALLSPGDKIRFEPVTTAELDQLTEAAAAGEWRPEPEARAPGGSA